MSPTSARTSPTAAGPHPAERAASSHEQGFRHLDRGRSIEVETPEHVRLGFELAGLGSRWSAALLDLLVISVASFLVIITVAALGVSTGELITNLGMSVGILLLFAFQWGYFFLAEGFFGGRTLGKRWIGLRVVGAGCTPITLPAAALRNLLRIVDIQPAGSSLVGLGLIALHPRSQRLGDIVAGTVVVRDRGTHEIPEQRVAELPGGRAQLDAQRFGVLERFVARADTLPPDVRSRLAGTVAHAMGEPVARHPRRTSMRLEDLLRELYEQERPLQSYAAGTTPQAVQLVRSQRGVWDRCRALVEKAGSRRGLRGLSEAEVQEFTTLYREVTADLARAHTYGGSLRLCFHLERLAAEAHNLFYRSRRARFSIIDWIRRGFPVAYRRHAVLVAIASLLLFAPAAVTYMGVRADPELARSLLPPEMLTRAEEAGARMRAGEQYIDVPPVQMSLFSSSVMTNNLQVAFLAAAGGVLAGLGSVFILVFNGVHLGSAFALYDAHGAGALLWTFVLPHGVMEMTAIVLAGGAGLLLGRAVLTPGRRTRARALLENGREALSLVAGAGVLLVLAGLVEGYVSPAQVPAPLKLGFASTVALLLTAYLAGAGRRRAG